MHAMYILHLLQRIAAPLFDAAGLHANSSSESECGMHIVLCVAYTSNELPALFNGNIPPHRSFFLRWSMFCKSLFHQKIK